MSFPRRFRLSRYFVPQRSIIGFVLTEEVPKCPDAGNICRRDNTRTPSPFDFTNLRGCTFGTRIAHQHANAQRIRYGLWLARVDDGDVRYEF